jgi:hypothetical protein
MAKVDPFAWFQDVLSRIGVVSQLAELEKYGVRVRSMTEEFDTATSTGRLMLTMLSGLRIPGHENYDSGLKKIIVPR